jgi:hypothetical protein
MITWLHIDIQIGRHEFHNILIMIKEHAKCLFAEESGVLSFK